MDVIWWVTAAVGAIAVNLIASELFAWGPRLSEWLMRRAVTRLAPEMQERMQEEWAGHLQTIPPGLWRIVAAAGFYLATRQINVALRVRERQEKPEQKTLQEKVSGKIEGIAFSVDVGMVKSAFLTEYRNRLTHRSHYTVTHLNRYTNTHLDRYTNFLNGYTKMKEGKDPHDEPEPPSEADAS
jgi:hypothetical protein